MKVHQCVFLLFFLILMTQTSLAMACDQDIYNSIANSNSTIEKLKKKYRCARVPDNSTRSKCWRENAISDVDRASLDEAYYALNNAIEKCDFDRVRFNLGDYKQSFGDSCGAVDLFNALVKNSSRKNLTSVLANAVLQCSKDSVAENENGMPLNKAHQTLRNLAESTNDPDQKRKVLSAWRDLFALNVQTSDAEAVSQQIRDNKTHLIFWPSFLQHARTVLMGRRNQLFPKPDDLSTTAQQYYLLSTKL